jgi:hypothetical protein
MTFTSTTLLIFLGLAVLIVLVFLVLKRFGIKYYSISFGVGHFLFIVIMACLYYTMPIVAQHQLFWISPELIDLPISLLVQILAPDSMTIYIALLATLGSFQYAAIGWCIDYKLSKDRKLLIPNKCILVVGACVFIGLAYWSYRNLSYLNLNEYEKSVIELENAKTEVDRFRILDKAAKSSFKFKKYDKAKNYAEELLVLSQKHKNEVIYGSAIYDSHVVLGRLALLDGKPEQAIYHLFEAAKTPGDAALASFGPDMSLAKDLLEKGYKEPVIEFLIRCKSFWEFDEGKVDRWVKEINEGKMPDFGTSLD